MAGLGVAGLMIGLLLVGARHAVPFFVGQAFLPVLFVMPVLLVGPRCSCEHTNADVSRYKVPGCLPFCARLLFTTPPAACHSELACEFRRCEESAFLCLLERRPKVTPKNARASPKPRILKRRPSSARA